MSRRAPVVQLPSAESPELSRLIGALHQSLGFLVSYMELALVRDEAGMSVAPTAGGTVVVSGTHVVDWNDTGVDEWRLTGWALDAASGGRTIEYRVNGVTLAAATLPQGAAAVFAGAWTRISLADRQTIAGDQTGKLVVVGTGAAIALSSVTLQAHTVSRVI